MPYDPRLVQPMRDELTRLGFDELTTPEAVDQALRERPGTTLVFVNSVCGCSARHARPAAAIAVRHPVRPDHLVTVFAGQDLDATARARSYFTGRAPSSPQIALLRDGRMVFMLERREIEGREASAIAGDLVAAFDEHCEAQV
jgi:bacilliredoxin